MEPERRALLDKSMAAMAAGDAAFIYTVVEHFGDELAGCVRRIVAGMGRRDILADGGEIDGLVQDVALFLFDHAGAWQPDGALPWVWAERGIVNLISAAVGHRVVADAEDLDAEAGAAPPRDTGLGAEIASLHGHDEDLAALARQCPEIALLLDALLGVTNERNAQVFVEYRLQRRLGDHSPAHTVGAMFALSPDNIRQIHHRVTRRLEAALDDDRYRPIADLALLVA